MSKKRKNSNYQTEAKRQESEKIVQKRKNNKTFMIILATVCFVAGLALVLLAAFGGN
ncbi:MAG: hypothetical protein IJW54_00945 [Clostridia bacterium]|nr:hypothetical protein [Clostridia bacterium]